MIKSKKINCKTCKAECWSGKRGLCDSCHKKEAKAKVKVAKVKEKVQKKKAAKRVSKSTLMKVADDVFSLYIRLRETDSEGNGVCCSSGKFICWTSIDLGHYIPRGYMKYRYDERNCHTQSKHDNGRLHGNIPEYRRFIIKKYGEKVEQEMFFGSKEEFHTTTDFFMEIIQKYLPLLPNLLQSKSFDTENYFKRVNIWIKFYLNAEL